MKKWVRSLGWKDLLDAVDIKISFFFMAVNSLLNIIWATAFLESIIYVMG